MRTDYFRRRRPVSLLLAVLVLGATVAVALDGPAWLTTALSVTAVLTVTGRLMASRDRGWADAVLVGSAGLLVMLILLGLLLDVLPAGLDRVSWAVGSGVVALAALAWTDRRSGRLLHGAIDTPAVRRLSFAYVGAAALAAVALTISVNATDTANRSSEALSIVHQGPGRRVRVEISAGHAPGHYELVVTTRSGSVSVLGPYTVPANGRTTQNVRIPDLRRSVISLRRPGSTTSLRTLVVSQTDATP